MVNGDGKTIVSCLKGSDSKLIQVAEDESKIRRNPEMVVPAFDDNYKRLQKNRTCYVKVYIFYLLNNYVIVINLGLRS